MLCVALVAALAALAGSRLELPGPYYDEVVQAVPAAEFLDGRIRGAPLPGSQALHLAGRPFPWLTQAYMGALKSQLLIASFALAGEQVAVLRATTLVWSTLGLLAALVFGWRALGAGAAALGGLLLVTDPSFVFLSRHDWGSFALGFALRCGALAAAVLWWDSGKARWALAAGAALGLGVYNKIDFAVFPAAALGALLVAGRGTVAAALRQRRAQVLGAAALAGLLALPIAVSLFTLAGEAGRLAEQVAFAEKWRAHGAVLDGSYFLRLMRAGGRFDVLFAEPAPRGGLGLAAAVAALGLGAALLRRRAPRGSAFVLVCGGLTLALLLLAPGAARAHHVMNAWPFPHWILALGLLGLWGRGGGRAFWLRRTLAVAVLAGVVGANLRVVERTHAEIRASGGRGFWSDAISTFAAQARERPGLRVVCLDWGFHTQIALLAPGVRSLDAIWAARRELARGRAWVLEGDARTIYLVHAPPYDLFPLGSAFRDALDERPAADVTVRRYRDRLGHEAFRAVRLAAPHRLGYDGASLRLD